MGNDEGWVIREEDASVDSQEGFANPSFEPRDGVDFQEGSELLEEVVLAGALQEKLREARDYAERVDEEGDDRVASELRGIEKKELRLDFFVVHRTAEMGDQSGGSRLRCSELVTGINDVRSSVEDAGAEGVQLPQIKLLSGAAEHGRQHSVKRFASDAAHIFGEGRSGRCRAIGAFLRFEHGSQRDQERRKALKR